MSEEFQKHVSEPGAAENEGVQAAQEAVREAVESGQDVRERVRAIIVDLLSRTRGPGASLDAVVRGMYDTAADVVKRSAPEHPESVLRGVIDGVTSGVQTIAQTTQYAIEEANARGQRFAGSDLEFAKKNMNAAADILVDTVRYASQRAGAELGIGARELKTHAERAVESVRPVVSATLEAITRHPVQTASEMAGTTLRGGRLAAGAILGAVSGVLAGAAEFLDPDRGKKP